MDDYDKDSFDKEDNSLNNFRSDSEHTVRKNYNNEDNGTFNNNLGNIDYPDSNSYNGGDVPTRRKPKKSLAKIIGLSFIILIVIAIILGAIILAIPIDDTDSNDLTSYSNYNISFNYPSSLVESHYTGFDAVFNSSDTVFGLMVRDSLGYSLDEVATAESLGAEPEEILSKNATTVNGTNAYVIGVKTSIFAGGSGKLLIFEHKDKIYAFIFVGTSQDKATNIYNGVKNSIKLN
ncbi:hypothetical protein [Methanobrevibacter filiformis]|uniref:Uncharacterized protein n=1 Tax=Methanobrevibacter filiformis TaxID=55758 RepID=A0A166AUU4_9EURY|nr:hypothetical protein [Methanobrevibacter filiformis]KZX12498.1 hypothetical protein MBFIL_11450 [Methanobrevibacter filiformis]